MTRRVHAEGLRERQRMREHNPTRTLGGTTFRYECRICGADHGEERHTDCPDCGHSPYDFNPRIQDHVTWAEKRKLPFRTNTCWASRRVKIIGEEPSSDSQIHKDG